MKKYISIIVSVLIVVTVVTFAAIKNGEASAENRSETKEVKNMAKKIGDFKVKDIDGKEVDLSIYEGKVVLIVNVASKCGYTKQYNGLEAIYNKYKDQGLVILGFPCNDFGGQEPGTNDEIKEFCSTKFSVTFPMMDKVSVLGDNKTPLFAFLTDNAVTGTKDIKWNFEKFLINKKGEIVERFVSKDEPEGEKITKAIEAQLK
ncbi:MAG: glutathione peroxidase [Ignavibacteriaceae bacterium]|jgi:glutathione peroxidase|nr:glutathione peroxidase [Ignavibacteriaceae bacterium]